MLRGDQDLLFGSAPPSPPRSLNDLRPTDEQVSSSLKKSPIIPLLNVSSVSKVESGYYEEYDDDEPPLTDIREIILSSRDRGAFEAGEWSEIKSEISDIRYIHFYRYVQSVHLIYLFILLIYLFINLFLYIYLYLYIFITICLYLFIHCIAKPISIRFP